MLTPKRLLSVAVVQDDKQIWIHSLHGELVSICCVYVCVCVCV